MEKIAYKTNTLQFAHEENLSGNIRKEYEALQALFCLQSEPVQRFLEEQGRSLSEMILERQPRLVFTLPDRIVLKPGQSDEIRVPNEQREQWIGGFRDRIIHGDIQALLYRRIEELEQYTNLAIAISAMLIRHVTAMYMVHKILPEGHSVRYSVAEDDDIPSKPEESQGTLVSATGKFYFPDWVAFGNQGELLVKSISEAEVCLASMQQFLAVLHAAVRLAPYIVVDEVYQQKRYGMMGQLVNQGRAYATYQTEKIIKTIKSRASVGNLNRGLMLALPYFDDQELIKKEYKFEVIPVGLIMFIPAFVVLAVHNESGKISQDTRLSPSTRKHLLREMRVLEQAFERNY